MTERRVYNVYCESTKTCPWKRLQMLDKDEALALGKQHAIDKHPTIEDWQVRITTIRIGQPAKKKNLLWK